MGKNITAWFHIVNILNLQKIYLYIYKCEYKYIKVYVNFSTVTCIQIANERSRGHNNQENV